jgi:hypothetical protein
VTLKAEDLAKEYSADKKATAEKYADKLLVVSGVVFLSDSDNAAELPQLAIKGDPKDVSSLIQCMFPASMETKVIDLVEGQTVTIEGVIEKDGFSFGVPLLECELTEIGISPALNITAEEFTKIVGQEDSVVEKYNYKVVVITGEIKEVQKEGINIKILLKGHDNKETFIFTGATVSKKMISYLGSLKKGDKVKAKGKAFISMNECSVQMATVMK